MPRGKCGPGCRGQVLCRRGAVSDPLSSAGGVRLQAFIDERSLSGGSPRPRAVARQTVSPVRPWDSAQVCRICRRQICINQQPAGKKPSNGEAGRPVRCPMFCRQAPVLFSKVVALQPSLACARPIHAAPRVRDACRVLVRSAVGDCCRDPGRASGARLACAQFSGPMAGLCRNTPSEHGAGGRYACRIAANASFPWCHGHQTIWSLPSIPAPGPCFGCCRCFCCHLACRPCQRTALTGRST